eukprot:5112788-Prymnesium_polylepis.1
MSRHPRKGQITRQPSPLIKAPCSEGRLVGIAHIRQLWHTEGGTSDRTCNTLALQFAALICQRVGTPLRRG